MLLITNPYRGGAWCAEDVADQTRRATTGGSIGSYQLLIGLPTKRPRSVLRKIPHPFRSSPVYPVAETSAARAIEIQDEIKELRITSYPLSFLILRRGSLWNDISLQTAGRPL